MLPCDDVGEGSRRAKADLRPQRWLHGAHAAAARAVRGTGGCARLTARPARRSTGRGNRRGPLTGLGVGTRHRTVLVRLVLQPIGLDRQRVRIGAPESLSPISTYCSKPVRVASTMTSAPGTSSGWRAVVPSGSGAGRAPFHCSVMACSPLPRVTRSRRASSGAAAGERGAVPPLSARHSALGRSFASTGPGQRGIGLAPRTGPPDPHRSGGQLGGLSAVGVGPVRSGSSCPAKAGETAKRERASPAASTASSIVTLPLPGRAAPAVVPSNLLESWQETSRCRT